MSHYFETPVDNGVRRSVRMTLWGNDVELSSARGVFSGAELDIGTAVLLRSCDPPEGTPRVLDLGCGIGPLALAVALECPGATVRAIDVNSLAVTLTNENAARLGVADRVTACHPDEVPDGETYDEIWSNPPIRIGKQALHDLLETWLARLAPGGVAHLVVARNLGADSLATWLAEQGHAVGRVASAKGFRVLEITRDPLP